MRRGETMAQAFAADMVETLNSEQNRHKKHWLSMSWEDIKLLLVEEMEELLTEIEIIQAGDPSGLAGVRREAPDVGNAAAFARDKATWELVTGGKGECGGIS